MKKPLDIAKVRKALPTGWADEADATYASQEKAVHKLLHAYRLSGEWFQDAPPVREFVDFLSAGSLDSYLTTDAPPA